MKKFLLLISLALALAACATRTASWDTTSLRTLDPVDSDFPTTDITALYTRQIGLATEIRVDLLDIPYDPALEDYQQTPLPDIYIALDTQPGGSFIWAYPKSETAILDTSALEYDVLVAIPGKGKPAVYTFDSKNGLQEAWWLFPSAQVDRLADTITVRFLSLGLPKSYNLQAIALDSIQFDQTSVVGSDDTIESKAPVMLVFYDVFPATTPAQALRRWDGAHTGPYGERHGLKHLLEAADKYAVPITLIDLVQPERLSALDYVGGMKLIGTLQAKNLVDMPSLQMRDSLPAPDESDQLQPTNQGLTLEARSALLDAAQGEQPLVWGGEMSYSAWGNADVAAPSMAYLAARPYIELILPWQFAALPQVSILESVPALSQLNATEYEGLIAQMPASSQSTQLAERMLAQLTSPNRDPKLIQLRTLYLEDLRYFEAVAKWEISPTSLATCDAMLGISAETCLLADERFFAVLRADGARLAYLFSRDEKGIHQIIGPTYQFETGLSDRTHWILDRGQSADPDALGGAFVDTDTPWAPYQGQVNANGSITFTGSDGMRSKIYTLTSDGIHVSYKGVQPTSAKIGLVLDPWQRFESGWGNLYRWTASGDWEVLGGPSVSIQAAGSAIRNAFIDSREKMGTVEDPNYEYPAGHFIPFPIAIFEISLVNGASIIVK